MVSPTPQPSRSADERLYLQARVVLAALLLLVVGYELLWTAQRENWALFWFLWVLLVSNTAMLGVGIRRGAEASRRVMRILALPDLVIVGGLEYVLHSEQDVFYPVALLLPIAYALIMDRRWAIGMGLLSMTAYGVGHALTDPLLQAEFFTFLLKLSAVPLIASMVASSIEKQRAREAETHQVVAEKASLNEVLARRLSELQAVSEITEIIHSSLDFERVGPVVLEILGKVLGVETCCLFVIDKERSETLFSASHGQVGRLPSYPGVAADGSAEDHFACMTAFDHKDTMVLFCATADELEDLTEEDRLVLGAVASELVVAVENSRLYKLTKKLAITDELTGLANYRQLQQKLDDEIERANRYGKRLSLVMIDVDDFKYFNDTQGHIAGDAALAELGRVVTSVVREVDLVARYGGEEFSVVLPETDSAGAFVAAEKVREAVANHLFCDVDGSRNCGLTVSLGVATYPTHASDKESLLRDADDALYRAKHGGKNRVRTPVRRPDDVDGPAPAEDAAGPVERAAHDTDESGD